MGVNDVNLERPKQTSKNPLDKTVTRRTFIKLAAVGGALVVGEAARLKNSSLQVITKVISSTGEPKNEGTGSAEAEKNKAQQVQQAQKDNQAPAQQNNPSQAGQENQSTPKQPDLKKEPDPGFDRLNEILALPLSSKIRLSKEGEYVEWTQTLEQIDNGFLGVFNVNLRGKLLDKRFALREKGHPRLLSLSKDDRDWAIKNGFHPESLAICIDSYNEAKKILQDKFTDLGGQQFYEIFRPDLVTLAHSKKSEFTLNDLANMQGRKDSADEMLINPGGLLYLIHRETGMNLAPSGLRYLFVNLGENPAVKMLARAYPEDKEPEKARGLIAALKKICQKLSRKGPLNYEADNVPGSELSGDIGSYQALPETFLREDEFSEKVFGKAWNPYGLEAVTLAYLFLAHGWAWKTPDGKQHYQIGYLKNSINGKNRKPFRMDALIKWNSTLAEETLKWAEKYYDEVVEPRFLAKRVAFKALWKTLTQKAA